MASCGADIFFDTNFGGNFWRKNTLIFSNLFKGAQFKNGNPFGWESTRTRVRESLWHGEEVLRHQRRRGNSTNKTLAKRPFAKQRVKGRRLLGSVVKFLKPKIEALL